MPWNSKSTAQAKKVAPPAIPLDHHHHRSSSTSGGATIASSETPLIATTNLSSDILVDDGISLQLRDNSVAFKMKGMFFFSL